MSNQRKNIANKYVSLSVNERGGIVSLYNRVTKTELITFPEKAEPWRLVIPTGRHTLGLLWGSSQKPETIEVRRDESREAPCGKPQGNPLRRSSLGYAGRVFAEPCEAKLAKKGQSLTLVYERIKMGKEILKINAEFTLSLENDSNEILASVKLENFSPYDIDEVEFPILRGLGGFAAKKGACLMNLVASKDNGSFYEDIINKRLPVIRRASNHYAREQETAMFDSQANADKSGHIMGPTQWLDLWCPEQGLYFGHHPAGKHRLVFKLERFPKGVPNGQAHAYPPGTPHYISVFCIHVPRLVPGKTWTSEKDVVITPHAGDWHTGADKYSAYRHNNLPAFCEPPQWMNNFVGWTEIVGKLYTGEVFHDYCHCANQVIKDKKVTGIDFVFYYGHSKLGAEGADFDHLPSPDLGAGKGFRTMVKKLHRNGIRIMLLDHMHRWINKDIPEYKKLKLERYAVLDENGKPSVAHWWKETVRSCLDLSGPTPEWIQMCPSCEGWLKHYLCHITRMIELGVDGMELDTYLPSSCFNPAHDHEKGGIQTAKREFMRAVREHAKRLNPDFVLIGETMLPETREVLDGWYPSRYFSEEGRIHRYLFPEIRTQAVLVGNYAYDQVNKALQLGIGVETEIWGLRKTTLEACPELAEYIGEVNRLKRRYPHIMIQGLFRDTVGTRVQGKIYYSLLEASNGDRAIVLRNYNNRSVKTKATFEQLRKGDNFRLWRPFQKERRINSLPVSLQLKPYEAAVLLATKS